MEGAGGGKAGSVHGRSGAWGSRGRRWKELRDRQTGVLGLWVGRGGQAGLAVSGASQGCL